MFSNRASKSGKRGFGKRRTVVQLDDEPRKQPTYGFGYKPTDEVQKHEVTGNALSGIMSQYAMDSPSDDNSGDNEDESPSNGPAVQETQRGNKWPKFVAATDTQLPTLKATDTSVASEKSTDSKQHQDPPVSSRTGGAGDDIDIKLKDFLAEIESIDVAEKQAEEQREPQVDEKLTRELKPHGPKLAESIQDSDADNGIGTSEDDASPPVEPKEPTSVWQHCLDEGTQCYYYWNTETNEVTWEIPAEFSQFLLRYKEYERQLAKYEKEMAEWKRQHGSRKRKKLAKKERKHKKNVDEEKEVIEPLVSYPPIPEDEEEEATEEEALLVYGPQKPPDEVLEKLAENESTTHDAEPGSVVPQTSHTELKETSSVKSLVATNDADKMTAEGCVITKKRHRSKSSKHHAEAEDVEVEKHHDAKSHDSEVRSSERKAKSQNQDAKAVSQSSPVTDGYVSSSTGIISCASDDGKTCETVVKVLSDVEDEKLLSVGEAKVEELEDEEEFVNRELEEPIFTHYEYVNKKYEEGQSDDVDLAAEDIDRELELALERRMNKTEAGFVSKKRKQEFLEEDSNFNSKRKKTEIPVDVPVNSAWKSSIRDEIKTKVDELAEVLDLASTVLEKLEFLEVSQSCLSKLQVLLVQTQTRLEDWKAGGLSTTYVLQRLQESASTLLQYEQNASPPGWSCLWDRPFKRYFYSNNVTGETSWAYPEVIAEVPEKLQGHGNGGTRSPCRGAVFSELEQLYRSDTSQAATEGTMLAHVHESSEIDSENALPIPIDLLSWAANPPPPPPATPPPPPSPSQMSEPFSSTEMDFDDHVTDEQAVNSSVANRDDATNEDSADISAREPVHPPIEPPGQISAPPMITKSSPQQTARTDKDGVHNVVSPDGITAPVLPSGATQEELYDGVPMEDPATGHPVKEKKKKKEKPSLGGGLAMKKKNVSSMVEKWQRIQDDFSKEDEKERNRQMKLAELAGKAPSSKTD